MWNLLKRTEQGKLRFTAVRQLLEGHLRTGHRGPSLLFFTVHKAASSFVGRLLRQIGDAHGIRSIDYDGYLHSVAETPQDRDLRPILRAAIQGQLPSPSAGSEAQDPNAGPNAGGDPNDATLLRRLFPAQGCYFGPIRRPALLDSLPHLEDFRTLVLLRDPRDCLTSMYFSVAFSHRAPDNPEEQQRFHEVRERTRQLEIDQFVLAEAPGWVQRYEDYCRALRNHSTLTLVTYEQLVQDFPAWVDSVAKAWDLTLGASLRRELQRKANFDVQGEDVYAHKRQVQPGDHLRKLQPETIQRLTDMFRPSLEQLGYPLIAEDRRAA